MRFAIDIPALTIAALCAALVLAAGQTVFGVTLLVAITVTIIGRLLLGPSPRP